MHVTSHIVAAFAAPAVLSSIRAQVFQPDGQPEMCPTTGYNQVLGSSQQSREVVVST